MTKRTDEFMECAGCAAKPGSPVLCESCLHNRGLESQLRKLTHALRALLPKDFPHEEEIAKLRDELSLEKYRAANEGHNREIWLKRCQNFRSALANHLGLAFDSERISRIGRGDE